MRYLCEICGLSIERHHIYIIMMRYTHSFFWAFR